MHNIGSKKHSSDMIRVVKLADEQKFTKHVITALQEQHFLTYGDNININKDEIIRNTYRTTYIIVKKTTHVDENIVGFFTLSRIDYTNTGFLMRLFSWCWSMLVGRMYIYDVYIFPAYRKRGHGTWMINQAINICASEYNCKCIRLHTTTQTLGHFYALNGFRFIVQQNLLYVHELSTTKMIS